MTAIVAGSLLMPSSTYSTAQVAEFGSTTVTSNNWTTINLSGTYQDLIVVASARYAPVTGISNNPVPRSPRVIKASNSFQIKVDNHAASIGATETTTVDWIAMEAGTHAILDGTSSTKAIAGSVTTGQVACKSGAAANWLAGPRVTFTPNFSGSPVVIHTVSSNNDTEWIASQVNNGATRQAEPTTSTMELTLMDTYDGCTHTANESIDYIAFDEVHGTFGGVEFDAVRSNDGPACCNANGYNVNFKGAFSSAPGVVLAAMLGVDGGDGGHGLVHTGTAVGTTNVRVGVDEDGPGADRNHTTEVVGVIAFGGPGTLTAYKPNLSTSTKTVDDLNGGTVQPGDRLKYDITLINTGDIDADGTVTVTDTVDTDTTIDTSTVTSSNCGGADTSGTTSTALSVSVVSAELATNCVISFEAIVNNPAVEGASIDNTAQIVIAGGGQTTNPSSSGVTIDTTPNLSVTKTENDADNIVNQGQTYTYSITITNNGDGLATGVTLADALTGQVSGISNITTTDCGTPNNTSSGLNVDLDSLQIATTAPCVITYNATVSATATGGTLIRNEADVSAAAEGGNDPAIVRANDMTVFVNPAINVSVFDSESDETGDTAVVRFTLSKAPTSSVTIPLSIADSSEANLGAVTEIVITPTNWNNPIQNQIIIFGADDNIDDGTVAYTLTTGDPTSPADADFNGLTAADVADPSFDNLDNDTAGFTVSPTSLVTQESGSSVTFAITLNSEPTGNVSIPITSSDTTEGLVSPNPLVITPGNWNNATTNLVTVTPQNDPVGDGTITYTVITGDPTSSDAVYDAFVATDVEDVTVQNENDDPPGFSITATDATLGEDGSTATVEVRLLSQPLGGADVSIPLSLSDSSEASLGGVTSITITNANWNTPSANQITITGVDDTIIDGDIDLQLITGDPTSADSLYNDLDENSTTNPTITNTDDDTAGVIVATTDGVSGEDVATATVQFSLDAEPTGNVTIPLSISDASEGSIAVSSIVIAPADWNDPTANEITITGLDDDVIDGTVGYQLVTGNPSSSDAAFNALNATDVPDASLTNVDNDVAGVSATALSGTVSETGTTATFQITLDSRPSDPVTIALTSSDTSEASVATSITIQPDDWNDGSANIITVTGVDDSIVDGAQPFTITTGNVTSTDANYNALDGSTITDPTSTVTDDDTAGVVVFVADNTTDEPGTGTATVRFSLSSEPLGDVTIPLSIDDATEGNLGATTNVVITAATWDDPAANEITITGVDDTIIDGSVAYNLITGDPTSPLDTAFDGLTDTDVANAALSNEDDDSAGVTITESAGSTAVVEGGATDTYTIVLTAQPTGIVTVTTNPDSETLASPATLTFDNTNWNLAQTVTVTAYDDNVVDGDHTGAIGHSIASAADAAFDGISASGISVDISDNDSVGVTVSPVATTTTEAGGTISVEFTLTSIPSENVTIPLSISDATEGSLGSTAEVVITPADWNDGSANAVTITGVDDTLVDGSVNYTLVTGDPASPDFLYDGLDASNTADPTLSNTDNDTAGITVNATDIVTGEDGATGTIQFSLTAEPSANVTIPLSSNDTGEGTVPASVIITPANWNNPSANEVTVTGADDASIDGTVGYTIVTGNPTSSDSAFNALTATDVADVAMTNTDNDTAGVNVSAISGNTTEAGGTASFEVTLTSQPSDNVTIALSSSDTGEGTVPASVTIAPADWNTGSANTVTVTGVDDTIIDGTVSYSIVTGDVTSTLDANYNALTAASVADVAVDNTDNDSAAIATSVTDAVSDETGQTAVVQFTLSSVPTGNVTIPLSISDTTEASISASSIVITPANWNLPANNTVTITGVDDAIIDGTVAYSLVTGDPTSSDGDYDALDATDVADASLSNQDDDTAGVMITQSSGSTNVEEAGATDTYEIVLDAEPSASVTVTITPDSQSDIGAGVGTARDITFSTSDWSSAQTITVTASDDNSIEGSHTSTIAHTSSSTDSNFNALTINNVVASIVDNDSAGITVSPTTVTTSEDGTTATVQFSLSAQPTANVSIPVSISDTSEATIATAQVVILPANWNTPGANELVITGSNDSLVDGAVSLTLTTGDPTSTDSDFDALGAADVADVSITNNDNDTAGIIITETSGDTITSEDGTGDTFLVRLSAEPTADVQITLQPDSTLSLGGGAGSSRVITFNSTTWNTDRSIDVDAINNDLVDGSRSAAINITSGSSEAAFNSLSTSLNVTINDDDSAGITTSTIDAITNEDEDTAIVELSLTAEPTHAVTIPLSLSDTTEASLAANSITIQPTDWNNPSANIVTITGVNDSDLDGTVAYNLTLGDPTSTDPAFDALTGASTSDIPLTNEDNDTDSDGDGTSDEADEDIDGDGVNNDIEDAAINSGDGNGDGIQDSLQSSVTSLISDITGEPVTLAVTGTDCQIIDGFDSGAELSQVSQDLDYAYPLGLFDFELICTNNGDATQVTFYLDTVYDTSNWEWRKLNRNTAVYSDMNSLVTISTQSVGSLSVTTATYGLSDGGTLDEDSASNARILDPSGPAIVESSEDGLSPTGENSMTIIIVGAAITAAAISLTLNKRTRKTVQKEV